MKVPSPHAVISTAVEKPFNLKGLSFKFQEFSCCAGLPRLAAEGLSSFS